MIKDLFPTVVSLRRKSDDLLVGSWCPVIGCLNSSLRFVLGSVNELREMLENVILIFAFLCSRGVKKNRKTRIDFGHKRN